MWQFCLTGCISKLFAIDTPHYFEFSATKVNQHRVVCLIQTKADALNIRSDHKPVPVLITGFGPFPGVTHNVSFALAQDVASELNAVPVARGADKTIEACVAELSVDWATVGEQLAQLYDTHRPCLAVHFGVCNTLTGLGVETQARNACSSDPDMTGCTPSASVLQKNGPGVRSTRLPVSDLVAACARPDMDIAASNDAGRYLCNAAYYASLALAARQEQTCDALFVHISEHLSKSDPAWRAATGTLLTLVQTALTHQMAQAANLNSAK